MADLSDDILLASATITGNTDVAKKALKSGIGVNKQLDEKGDSLLAVAASNGHTSIVQLLIDHGAQINARSEVTAECLSL